MKFCNDCDHCSEDRHYLAIPASMEKAAKCKRAVIDDHVSYVDGNRIVDYRLCRDERQDDCFWSAPESKDLTSHKSCGPEARYFTPRKYACPCCKGGSMVFTEGVQGRLIDCDICNGTWRVTAAQYAEYMRSHQVNADKSYKKPTLINRLCNLAKL